MTIAKRLATLWISWASATLNSTLSVTFSLFALSLDLSTILSEISTPTTRQPTLTDRQRWCWEADHQAGLGYLKANNAPWVMGVSYAHWSKVR